ncbi:MAG: hypothetical protein K5762_05230 [Bacilli bacterium]|nr:hypothetical protein [Bacilli bacterium]
MKASRFLIILGAISLFGTMPLHQSQTSLSASQTIMNATANDIIKERCQKAVDAVSLTIDKSAVVADFILPILGLYNTSLTWTSSNSSVLSIANVENENGKIIRARAVITRPKEDTTLTLTVKAEISGHEEDNASKSFTLTVLKASEVVVEEIPAEFEEDFSDYDVGLDLGDYYTYKQSGSEAFLASIVDETDPTLSNINNMVSEKAVRITSQRLSSDTRYTRKANIKTDEAKSGAYLEGYFLYTGDINGLCFEFLSGGNIVSGISLSSSGVKQYISGGYTSLNDGYIAEGVWARFRITFRPSSGYSFISIYDYEAGEFKTIGASFPGYFEGYGFSSGKKGNIDSFRIVNQKGKNNGYSYLSDLKVSLSPSTATEINPNRTDGIGEITNFEDSIFMNSDNTTTQAGLDPSTFVIHNRFDNDETFVYNDDYTITTNKSVISTAEVDYDYEITLTVTGEKKTIHQTVYTFNNSTKAELVSFKAGALKKDADDSSKATITLNGSVNRNDGTLYYAIMNAGATSPTAQEIINGSISNAVIMGNQAITGRDFSIKSSLLDISKKYDVYAILSTTNNNSDVASSLDISTVINVATYQDFYEMATDVDTASSTFRLTADIDFADYYWNYDNMNFEFHGILNGEGHKISNLTISSVEGRVGIFSYCYGDVNNITFENCKVYGAANVGLIGGNIYGGTYENLNFINCVTSVEPTLTSAGEGYFGILGGRCRGDGKTVTLNNISIENMLVECPKYCGLLTGGIEKGVICNINNMYASGSVNTEGAAVGLIGRNRGTTTINNLVCFLNILNAKKEVGVVAGHNKEGAKLIVNNAILDLKIRMITQPGYFGSFIGSHDAATSSYSYSNVAYIAEDYSDIAESITQDVKAYDVGNKIDAPEDDRGWEENTFIRDFNTNLAFQYKSSSNRPVLTIRNESDLSFTHAQFEKYVDELEEDKPTENHYYLIKAGNILAHLEDSEVSLIDTAKKNKYDKCLKDYQDLVSGLLTVVDEIGLGD